ncbi:MAG: alanine dehydrogenase [Cytophagales bacterium]|nr:alanine dehydrogenase [Cytophagales bacterium]
MKIGIIKEGKVPVDHRVPLMPEQAKEVMEKFPDVKVVVQSSHVRVFKDDEYLAQGVEVVDSVADCDVIFGVKEVPIPNLLAEKTFFFFSHTIKKQEYNRDLLRAILAKNIRMVDYEPLTDSNGIRVIAFGRWAGIVGAYNGLLTYGRRYNLFDIRQANECYDLEDLKTEYSKINLPKMKIAITGGGRVAIGAMEVLHDIGIRQVTPAEFIEVRFDEPVFTQLNSRDYNRSKNGEFNQSEFHKHPDRYEGDFLKYARVTDLLIACAYWHPSSPVLFTKEEAMKSDFHLRVIADITCDIEGSIPSTKRSTTIADPIYDYNPSENIEEPGLTNEANISVMAVDNLPCELPRDASNSFGRELIDNVLPHLLGDDSEEVIKRATITENGKLTEAYQYLKGYVDGK